MDIKFTVPGPPVSKARARVTRWGSYTPPKTREATELVKKYLADVVDTRPWPISDGRKENRPDIGVSCKFYMRLKGHGADLDNLLKLVLDAGNGIAWVDDRQITKLIGEKFLYSDEPRTEVHIYTRNGGEL